MTAEVVLISFSRVRPDLDALTRERCPIARAAYSARHPESAFADPIHDRRAGEVVIGPARHRKCRFQACRMGGRNEGGAPGGHDVASTGKKATAIEQDRCHVDSPSYLRSLVRFNANP